MGRSRLIIALMALLAIVGIVLLLHDGDRETGTDEARTPSASSLAGDIADPREDAAPVARKNPKTPDIPAPIVRDAEPLTAAAPTVTVRGRVTDAAGVPLPGARVHGPATNGGVDTATVATTDADGHYSLVVQAGPDSMELRAEAAAHVAGSMRVVITASGTIPAEPDFALVQTTLLTGHVLWRADSVPCGGARVLVTLLPLSGDGAPLLDTTTDDTGTFRTLLPGSAVVAVAVTPAPGAPETRLMRLLPASGESTIEVRIPRPASVTLEFREAAATATAPIRNPLADPLLVLLVPHETGIDGAPGDALLARMMPATNGSATFENVDPDLAWDAGLRGRGFFPLTAARALRFPAGEHTHTVIELDPSAFVPVPGDLSIKPPTTMTFRCRFVDETGRVLRAEDLLREAGGSSPAELQGIAKSLADGSSGVVDFAPADDDGRCAAEVLLARPPIALTLDLGGGVLGKAPIGDGDSIDFVVPSARPAASLRIVVTDAHGARRLLSDATVLSRDTWAEQRVSAPDADGAVIAMLPPGSYAVFATAEHQLTGSAAIELAPGEAATVSLVVGATGCLSGALQPPPSADESATVQACAAGMPTLLASRAAVGSDGSFEIGGVPAGDYDVTAVISAGHDRVRGPERIVVAHGVRVSPGQAAAVVLHDAPDATGGAAMSAATGAVVLRAGGITLLREMFVSIEALDGSLRCALSLRPGEQRRLRLPPGSYTWQRFGAPGGLSVAKSFMLPQRFDVGRDPSAPDVVLDV